MIRPRAILLLACAVALSATGLGAQDEWARADSLTVRLAPSRFATLPAAVRDNLERRGCRIPQVRESTTEPALHNVVRGAFTGPTRLDWAVLCSVRDTSQILIYHNGASAPADSLARAADRDFLQGIGGGRIGFSRKITVASAAYIREHAAAYRGPDPPPVLDHLGIDDAFVGKVSVIYYFFRGKWLALQGAD